MQLREVALSSLVGLFLLSFLAIYPGSLSAAEFTVEGVVIDDGDNMQFVSFEDAAGTQYFDLRKNGQLKLNFVDNDQSTNYLLADQDFFGNEWMDIVGLGNTGLSSGGQGDTVYVVMGGPVYAPRPNQSTFGDTIFYHNFNNKSGLHAHVDDVHKARPRDLTSNAPSMGADDTGVVATHDGSGSKPAGRYQFIPANCPVSGFSGACWQELATGKKAINP